LNATQLWHVAWLVVKLVKVRAVLSPVAPDVSVGRCASLNLQEVQQQNRSADNASRLWHVPLASSPNGS
jgi:hypothetical protein